MTTAQAPSRTGARIAALGVIVVMSTAIAGLYVSRAADRVRTSDLDQRTAAALSHVDLPRDQTLDTAATRPVPVAEPSVASVMAEQPPSDPILGDDFHFVQRRTGDRYGRLGWVDPKVTTDRWIVDRECARVDRRNGSTACLERTQGLFGLYTLSVVGPDGASRADIGINGTPSRVRLSPSGGVVAWTSLTSGHSYAEPNTLSTETNIHDMRIDETISLEELSVTAGLKTFNAEDRNFWGVTFIDDDRFYATMFSGGVSSIIKGSVAGRTAEVITGNGECPAVSPDAQRLVFKQRSTTDEGEPHYQLVVHDLTSGERRALGETRSVDDQVAWLDDHTVLYELPGRGSLAEPGTDIWAIDVDDPQISPRLVLEGAGSPAPNRHSGHGRAQDR